MHKRTARFVLLAASLVAHGCGSRDASAPSAGTDTTAAGSLEGQWRSTVQFESGSFASVKDLEFMYVFNAGGTMMESSNYDGAPPVPPAYGIWHSLGDRQFEARYEFYLTKPPGGIDAITQGGGWLPAGRGLLSERLTLSATGDSLTSTIEFEEFDPQGRPMPGGGKAVGRGVRLEF